MEKVNSEKVKFLENMSWFSGETKHERQIEIAGPNCTRTALVIG